MLREKAFNTQNKLSILFVLFALAILSTGCSDSPNSSPDHPINKYEIDPIFKTPFEYWGGEEVFGEPISPSQIEDDITTQYFESGKFIFNKDAPTKSLYRLAPLGLEMGVQEPDVPPPDDPETHYLNGHTIAPEFYAFYQKLGPQVVGKPLTEPRNNLIRQRKEQLFENLGFYIIEGSSRVRLLAYGVWACGNKCKTGQTTGQSTIDIVSYIDPAFNEFVRKLGADFTGFALANAYLTEDGKWEQIMENVVLAADQQVNPKEIQLRPISQRLDIPIDAPLPRAGAPGRYFYTVEGKNGYEIPVLFYEYIEKHGEIKLFGPPITHYKHFKDQIYHQCFQNLCLMYDPTAAADARVRPEPLGYAYRVLYYHPPAEQKAEVPTIEAPVLTEAPLIETPAATQQENPPPQIEAPEIEFMPTANLENSPAPEIGDLKPAAKGREISLRIWQRSPVIDQQKKQEIEVWVVENGEPLISKKVELTVKMPDGSEQLIEMPPTGWNGQTSILLPEIQALNGTIIPFKACYQDISYLRVCVEDIFVIWNTH